MKTEEKKSVEEPKKHGCGYMTAEEYLDLEDGNPDFEFTKETIAVLGPEGRKAMREAPSNPYFPAPDMTLFEEKWYDGTKIKE